MQKSWVKVAFAAMLLLVIVVAGTFFYLYQQKISKQRSGAEAKILPLEIEKADCALSEPILDDQGQWYWEFSYNLVISNPNLNYNAAAEAPLSTDPVTPEGQSQSYELHKLPDGSNAVYKEGNFYRYNSETNTISATAYFSGEVDFKVVWNGGSEGYILTANLGGDKATASDTLTIKQPGTVNMTLSGKGNLGGYQECQQNAVLPTSEDPAPTPTPTPENPGGGTQNPPAACNTEWNGNGFWDEFTAGRITASEVTYNSDKSKATSQVQNNSTCSFKTMISSYKMYDQTPKLSTQEYFAGSELVTIAPGAAHTFEIDLPTCKSQIDLWYGTAARTLLDSNPYGYGQNPSVYRFAITDKPLCTTTTIPGDLVCAPLTQTAAVGQAASITATGGTTPYTWTALGAETPVTTSNKITVTYTTSGTKTITVKDAAAKTANCNIVVTVTEQQEPVVCAPKSQSGTVGSVFNLTATKGNGTYAWTATGGTPTSGTGSQFAVAYNTAGTHTVKVVSGAHEDTCTVTTTSGGGGGGGTPQLDIQVTKDVTLPSVSVGSETDFIVLVKNLGAVSATGVVVDDALPAPLIYISHQASQGTYDKTSAKWSIGALAVGQSVSLTFRVTVSQAGTHKNTATLTASVPSDTNPANNSDSAEVTATSGGGGGGGSPSLLCQPSSQTVPVGVSTAFYVSGGSTPYTWTAVGGTPASGQGASFSTTYSQSGTYVVRVSSAGLSATCQAVVSALVIPQLTDLELVKTVNKPQVGLGQQVVFTLFLRNTSNVPATNVTVRDILPEGLAFVKADPNGAYDSYSNTWQVGNLLANTTAVLQITVTANKLGTLVNQAEIWSSSPQDIDSTPGNGVTSEDDWSQAQVRVATTLPAAGSPLLPQSLAGGALLALSLATALSGRRKRQQELA